jgi:hypothetical protein
VENGKRNPLIIPDWFGTAAILAVVPYALFLAILTLRFSSPAMPPTGDEPHYLIVAHSLAVDGDLSLANNYLDRQYRLFYKGELAKRTSPSADRKRELPAQGLGLSFLFAPFYKLTLTVFPPALVGVLRLIMCSITTIVLYQLLKLSALCGLSSRASFFVLCGAAVASPLLTYSSLFYPELPAALLITIALRNLLEMEEHGWRAFFWLTLVPAGLLWLHPKYLALSICVLLSAGIFFYQTFRVYNRNATLLAILYAVIAAVGVMTFFLFLHDQYGGWSPNRIYAGWDKAPQSLMDLIRQEGIGRIGTMFRMSLGLWIDQRFGLIPFAPLYLLFIPGVIYMLRSKTGIRFVLIWFFIHYLILCWGAPLGGFAPPSRHMIVLLPIVLIVVAKAFSQQIGVRKILAAALFVLSWILAGFMYFDFRSLFTNVTWRNPDGISPFWQHYGVESLIPLTTASNLNWVVCLCWCIVLAGLSLFFYTKSPGTVEEDS